MKNETQGFNESEQYLSHLCQRSFLSLWSYTNVFRQPGHELCDVLVSAGSNIVIFSDKKCAFPNTDDIALNWKRWFRKAVIKSANQLWGAENWIRKYPERAFLDDKCTKRLPTSININEHTQIHLVLVAHGASEACKKFHGGSGSLMFHNTVVGLNNHKTPFMIGDLNRNKSFVHVLDDYTLDVLLQNRDTITDFTRYLKNRGKFLRGQTIVLSSGEEELLTVYMKGLVEDEDKGFILPCTPDGTPFKTIVLQEGCWDQFQDTPGRKGQIEANEISYMWDAIIERLSIHAKEGTFHSVSKGGFIDCEIAIRMMALQTRFERRILSLALQDILLTTDKNYSRLRVLPMIRNNTYFVLVLYPQEIFSNYEEYRTERRIFIQSACLVVMKDFPDAMHVVGIATETGIMTTSRTEDLMYINRADWNDERVKLAKKAQKEFDILTHADEIPISIPEYPES